MTQVIKRNNTPVHLDINKIKKVIELATKDLEVSPLELESSLNTALVDGVTTRNIQDNLITNAVNFTTIESPDWRYVAGRLLIMNIWKETVLSRGYRFNEHSFSNHVNSMVTKGLYDSKLLDLYSDKELDEVGKYIKYDRDLDYDYAGANLLQNRYLVEDELPQEMYMTISLLLASVEKENKLQYAKQFYDLVSTRKISLATPILLNLRKPNGNLSSCFILAINDNIESIFDNVKNLALISKNGGGAGAYVSKVRATGSSIRNVPNTSGGVLPWIKIINDTAVAVDQGGKRAGAITVALDIWHLDIIDLLECQTENGDQRKKSYDVFPQVVIPDYFFNCLENDNDWYLFDPHEIRTKFNIELADLLGSHFVLNYTNLCELADEGHINLFKKLKAKELLKHIINTQLETGLPYLFFKDTWNKYNPNKDTGIIYCTNLCVAPETLVFTDQGYLPINELANQTVNIWNGFEWSEVIVRKTGENQKLIKVKLSNGEELDCTEYHKFYLQDGYGNKKKEIRAKDLQIGDKLIKYQLPIIEGFEELKDAYTSGFFTGDGNYASNGKEIKLYGEKQSLINKLAIRNKRKGNKTTSIELDDLYIYEESHLNRTKVFVEDSVLDKFIVPDNTYTIKSRLEWLAGLLDSDGCVYRTTTGEKLNEQLTLSSIHKDFLREVRLMLQTLGVDSRLSDLYDEGYRFMPDENGSSKEYFCQKSYRLLINSNDTYKLQELGLELFRLKITKQLPQRSASHFIKVTEVLDSNRYDDTYCFTEPKRHYGMFNGILTGQCIESASNFSPDNLIHVCNLVSINYANVTERDLEEVCTASIRILDNTIDLTKEPVEEASRHNSLYRVIGVGSMGLADYLALNNHNFNTGKKLVNKLFENQAYYCTKASADLAVERGSFNLFSKSEWSKGNLIGKSLTWFKENSSNYERWEQLSTQIKTTGIRNSQLIAVAPNTSSSLLQGCAASILPIYSKLYFDKNSKGTVPIAATYIKEKFWYYQEQKDVDQNVIIDLVGTSIQPWIDTGISMELVINLNNGITKKDIADMIVNAWKKECKGIYYIRSITKGIDNNCISCAN